MKQRLRGLILVCLLQVGWVQADSPLVYVKSVSGDFEATYKRVFTVLENNGYFVVFEPNLGQNLANFKHRWGDNYNRNKLDEIRSMVFCSGYYANEISNLDPQLLALCPLHITLIHKAGVTQILFVRPSLVAAGSPAEKAALELEQDVIRTLESVGKTVAPIPAPTAAPASGQ
jgi:uncharacterized protein (DUF302 family)